jgi:hypothetical protein
LALGFSAYALLITLAPAFLGQAVAEHDLKRILETSCDRAASGSSGRKTLDACITVSQADGSTYQGVEVASSNEAIVLFTKNAVMVLSLKDDFRIERKFR